MIIVFFVDSTDGLIRFIDTESEGATVQTVPSVSEVALPPGDGNPLGLTNLNLPGDLHADDLQNLYVVDTLNNRVRRIWLGELLRDASQKP